VGFPGALGLLGGEEMRPPCEAFDRALISAAGEPDVVNVVPTALARNGSVSAAMRLARSYFSGRLGLEVRQVALLGRKDASRPEVVKQLRRSPLTYLLGGDPGHLLDSLLGTPAWEAIRAALREGSALAGSSAGAMVAGETLLLRSPNPRPEARHGRRALALLPGVVLIPHLHRFGERWLEAARREARGRDILGLDESTGIVYSAGWTVHGPGEARLWRKGAEPPRVLTDGARLRWRSPVAMAAARGRIGPAVSDS
jgi:cyanophycinase-like exopeptidase